MPIVAPVAYIERGSSATNRRAMRVSTPLSRAARAASQPKAASDVTAQSLMAQEGQPAKQRPEHEVAGRWIHGVRDPASGEPGPNLAVPSGEVDGSRMHRYAGKLPGLPEEAPELVTQPQRRDDGHDRYGGGRHRALPAVPPLVAPGPRLPCLHERLVIPLNAVQGTSRGPIGAV